MVYSSDALIKEPMKLCVKYILVYVMSQDKAFYAAHEVGILLTYHDPILYGVCKKMSSMTMSREVDKTII